MTDQLRVDAQEMMQAAEFADGIADTLIDRQQVLAGQMAELTDTCWQGSGADACGSAWQEWTDGFRRIIAGLHDESMALRLAASSYRNTDAHSSGTIGDAGSQI